MNSKNKDFKLLNPLPTTTTFDIMKEQLKDLDTLDELYQTLCSQMIALLDSAASLNSIMRFDQLLDSYDRFVIDSAISSFGSIGTSRYYPKPDKKAIAWNGKSYLTRDGFGNWHMQTPIQ